MSQKTMKKLQVKAISQNEKGEITINLSADAANADWIRAARLLKKGKIDEFKELENTRMFQIEEEDEYIE